MKNKKYKEEINKFDLEKMNFAKLKNMHLIKGGYISEENPDPDTGTATSKNCNRKKDQE